VNLGADYLQKRAALQNALADLADLARASKAENDTLATVASLGQQLSEPFLFVVAGEVKAGKSSLLNAIFGQEFCRVDVLPATDRIYLFKYGEPEQNVDINAHFAELHRPIEFLRDFNIVDTPGTNSIIAEHQEITERFVPLADLILFVFSVTNPWGASAWDFMRFIQQKWLKKVAFVVQQADLRSAEDLERIVSHLRQTSLQKLGIECPVFPVSAKLALESQQTGNAEQWEASQFQKLQDFINQSVAGGEMRQEKLASIQRTAGVVLRDLTEKTRNALAIIEQDFQHLTELKTILAQRQEQSLRQIGGFLRTVEQACDKCRVRGEEMLRERLTLMGTFKLMLHKGEWQQDFQKRVESDLQEAVQREITKGLDLIEGDLKSLWQSLHESLQRGFAGDSADRLQTARLFLDQRAEVVRKLDLTLLEQMSDRKIETQLKNLFGETAAWLRVPGAVAAVGGVATVIAALTHVAILDVTGTVAAVGAVGGTVVAIFKRGQILREYSEQMIVKREGLVTALEDQLKHAIALFYQDLSATFAPLEDFCNAEKARFEPLVQKAADLNAKLQ
jgi:GTPase SAR1 family protein